MKLIDTEKAVGTILCQDITQIIRGVTKDARFRKGHIVTADDIPVLLSLGKEHLYVWEQQDGLVHENDAAQRLLKLCKNTAMSESLVKEGKIQLAAETDGLFTVDSNRLIAINAIPDIMIATRHGNTQVRRGDKLAAFRVIPLAIQEKYLDEADRAAGSSPILSLHPWKIKKAAVITTGSEIYKGRIQDTFTPVIEEKLAYFDVKMIRHELCDDDTEQIKQAILDARAAGAELILCTGGMSVDPDDRTPGAVRQSGAQIVTYGAPLLPGAMFLMGYLPKTEDTVISPETNCWDEPAPENAVPVLGLPGCVMYAARTVFDVFLPRILAGRRIRKRDIVVSGEGGLCLGCDICTFPNCGFGKQETV